MLQVKKRENLESYCWKSFFSLFRSPRQQSKGEKLSAQHENKRSEIVYLLLTIECGFALCYAIFERDLLTESETPTTLQFYNVSSLQCTLRLDFCLFSSALRVFERRLTRRREENVFLHAVVGFNG